MLSCTAQASLSEQMSRRVRGIFGAMNFWAIIMYNLVSLNSLEFTELVARRLLVSGEGQEGGGVQNVPGSALEDRNLLQCPHLTSIPQGGSRGKGMTEESHPGPLPSTGFPQTTLAILFVTYCGVQLVKERERTLALEEEQNQDKLKPE